MILEHKKHVCDHLKKMIQHTFLAFTLLLNKEKSQGGSYE